MEQTGIGRGETSQKLEDVTGSMTFLNQTSLGFLNSLNGGDGSCLFPVRGGEEEEERSKWSEQEAYMYTFPLSMRHHIYNAF